MFIVSLHKVKISAQLGLYPQELILGNQFEVDIDAHTEKSDEQTNLFVDYSILNNIIHTAFAAGDHTLEKIAERIYISSIEQFPFIKKARIAVRKMNPPMQGEIAYAQVVFEK